MYKRIIALFWLLLLSNETIWAQSDQSFDLNLEKKIKNWLELHHVPNAAIGIIEDGKIVRTQVITRSDHQVNSDFRPVFFSVASLTKPVTMMLALNLVSNGVWQLDEPLANYWIDPDVKNDPMVWKLTTRHVLSHQGGFVNWRSMHPNKKLAFDNTPGTSFKYSGEGFEYLRRAIENKFKKPFDQLADSLLFKPIGMKNSFLIWNDKIEKGEYAGRFDQNGNPYPIVKATETNAAASLLTTIEDYTLFAQACLQGFGLSQAMAKEIATPQISVSKEKKVDMGLAWAMVSQLGNGEYALMHSGSDPGIRTLIVLLPKSAKGLVVLTNGDNGKKVYELILKEVLSVGHQILSRMNNSK